MEDKNSLIKSNADKFGSKFSYLIIPLSLINTKTITIHRSLFLVIFLSDLYQDFIFSLSSLCHHHLEHLYHHRFHNLHSLFSWSQNNTHCSFAPPSLNHVIDCQILIYQPVILSAPRPPPTGSPLCWWWRWHRLGGAGRGGRRRERKRDRASPSGCQPEPVINSSRCLVFASERGGVKRSLSLSLFLCTKAGRS